MNIIPTLLITDDDRDFRETLRSAFEPRGFETHLAADGEEALAILQSRPIHLLLVDMYMPRLTGLETIRRLKELSHPLPAILMSSALSPQIEQAAYDERVFSVLAKPCSFATIRDAVRNALQQTYSWAG
jgi:CheY-like chemotaxis protein